MFLGYADDLHRLAILPEVRDVFADRIVVREQHAGSGFVDHTNARRVRRVLLGENATSQSGMPIVRK